MSLTFSQHHSFDALSKVAVSGGVELVPREQSNRQIIRTHRFIEIDCWCVFQIHIMQYLNTDFCDDGNSPSWH